MRRPHFSRRSFLVASIVLSAALAGPSRGPTALYAQRATDDGLGRGFRNPPPEARLRCYWWWLNGNTNARTITRDLEAMKANGYGGAILVDAGGAETRGNGTVPAGPTFGSSEWRVLYRHALKEAARLGLVISLSVQSGWNLGGPTVEPKDAAKLLTWARLVVEGPAAINQVLPQPPQKEGYYRDIAVLALPLNHGPSLPGAAAGSRPAIPLLEFRIASNEYGMSAPDSTPLLQSDEGKPGDADALAAEVLDLTGDVGANGEMHWQAPADQWEILRIGYTNSGARVSTSSGDWQGLAIDYMDRSAFETYWQRVMAPLMADAEPYLRHTLKYLVTDSWELG